MEKEHQIPQQISSYQFRLVGDMTLKQFFQVAGGAVVSLLIYSSNLPGFIKWPFIVVSFLIGVGLAFFPIQDRPLEKWIILFVRSIYTPTLFVWRKQEQTPQFFQAETTLTPEPTISTEPTLPVAPVASTVPDAEVYQIPTHTYTPPPQQPPEEKEVQVTVPQVVAPTIDKSKEEPVAQDTSTESASAMSEPGSDYSSLSPILGQKSGVVQQAKFSDEAGPPLPSSKPNVIVGQVIDPLGKIVENAILEIRDSEGRPVRALKTNKLGHFMIVTPLINGTYEIVTEKDNLIFETVRFEARGEIIPPIAIWAKPDATKIEVPTIPGENIYQNSNNTQ